MSGDRLDGRCILVAEDEYLLAEDLRAALVEAGAEVIGPLPTVADALVEVNAVAAIDGAVLDVNLRGEMIFPVADALIARGVPFVFATGYDERPLPARFAGARRLEKPLRLDRIGATIAQLLQPAR